MEAVPLLILILDLLFQQDAPVELPVAQLPFPNKPMWFWTQTQPELGVSSSPCPTPHHGNAAPTGQGCCSQRGRGEKCLSRRDIHMNQGMFAPWGIAWNQTLPIILPTCGHDP